MQRMNIINHNLVRGFECHNTCMVNAINGKVRVNSSDVYFAPGIEEMVYKEDGDLSVHGNRDFATKYGICFHSGTWDSGKDPKQLFDMISDDFFVTIKISIF